MSYNVYRRYSRTSGTKRLILEGVTLEEAQEHCRDPETSSRTCTSAISKKRTCELGPWFDGYVKDWS